ncbi:MAG: hypothetical protein P1U84_12210 [Parvibaculaceae bacterium]|nr:hypothetical protein [Parvibaculaceae bacterium]
MPLESDAALDALLAGPAIYRPAVFVELDFLDAPVRAWSGRGSILWAGKVFVGVGLLGEGIRLERRGGVEVETLQLRLNGVPLENKALAMASHLYQGRDADVWLAHLTEAGSLVGDPLLLHSGPMDFMVVTEGAETASITLSVPSELIRLNQALRYFYTGEDQRSLTGDANDTFFDFIPKETEEIIW